VVKTLVESVAVRVQEPVDVIMSALKVATPAAATADVVPPRVQVEVSTTVSVFPVPVVSTLPYTSSTDTLKVVKTADALTVAGGSVVNTTFVGVPAVTTIPVLVAVVRASSDESVAVKVQGLVPPSTVTALNVAMPAEATALTVPVKVHEEVIAIVSVNPVVAVAPAPFSTVT
jgi:LysM repeat protein